jgi:spore coat-associated protein N
MHPLTSDLTLTVFAAMIVSLRIVRLAASCRPLLARGSLSIGVAIRPAAIVGIALAAALAGAGVYATYTSTVSQSNTIASGTITVALGATGASTNRLNINASAIVAGDTMQRSVDLNNSGGIDLASITLTTTASPSSLLDTDTTDGLQMVIDKCSVAWTEAGTSPAFTYTCGGTTTSVLASRAVIGTNLTLSNLTLTAGAGNHLRVTLTLPSGTSNSTQGLSSTVTYAFTGTQRAATNK